MSPPRTPDTLAAQPTRDSPERHEAHVAQDEPQEAQGPKEAQGPQEAQEAQEAQEPYDPYEPSLRTGAALYLRRCDGSRTSVDVRRWLGPPDAADDTVLSRCAGPTLDVGCGPGRLVVALRRRGIPALGVDVAATAVRMTVEAGGTALRRSVFDPLPGEGRWDTALLADGNIGIGGHPDVLLTRVGALVRPQGRIIVETDPHDPDLHERFAARLEDEQGRAGRVFRWARLGVHAVARVSARVGLTPHAVWSVTERQFVVLTRARGDATNAPAPQAR